MFYVLDFLRVYIEYIYNKAIISMIFLVYGHLYILFYTIRNNRISNHLMFRVQREHNSIPISLVLLSYTRFVSNFDTWILMSLNKQFVVYDNYPIFALIQIVTLDTFQMYVVKEKYNRYNCETKTYMSLCIFE